MRKHLLLTLLACLFLSACATDDAGGKRSTTPPPQKRTGAVKQAVGGPVKARPNGPVTVNVSPSAPIDGTVIQHKNRSNAGLFAAVGGALDRGNADEYMEQQVDDLQRVLQSEIEQGEIQVDRRARDNAIRVSMFPDSGFDNLSSVINPGFLATLNKIASVSNQYGKTLLTVIGYIENVGPDAGNQKLAERRAKSVTDYFINQNVDPLRLQSYALRETRARADDGASDPSTRRVELWIQPLMAK